MVRKNIRDTIHPSYRRAGPGHMNRPWAKQIAQASSKSHRLNTEWVGGGRDAAASFPQLLPLVRL